MKESFLSFASGIIIGTFVVYLIMMFFGGPSGNIWYFKKSPQTNICYEVNIKYYMLSTSHTMSPVDNTYCEK